MAAGSQAIKRKDNKIYVMKWSNLHKTLNKPDADSDASEDEEEPTLHHEFVPHKGAVNRLKTLHGSHIVATWNDESEVGIYDVKAALINLQNNQGKKGGKQNKFGGCKLASFKHTQEGFALDWSPLTLGRLAAGSCNSNIQLYSPTDETLSNWA